MFIAMNRITIAAGNGEDLDRRFRQSHGIEQMPGFLAMDLMRLAWSHDAPDESKETFITMTRWESRDAFENWARSDVFKKAHEGPRPEYIVDSRPEGFSVNFSVEPNPANA